MRKAKFVLIFVLLALLLSAGPGAVMAQEPTPPVPDAALAQEPPPVSSPTPTYAQGEDPEGEIGPLGLWMYTNPSRWEFPVVGGRPHCLGVWTGRSGYGQAYTGPGGYGDTCSSSHGCIDTWTWWLTYPESKLGIPFIWRSVPWETGRRKLENYWAWNYIW
jgi:hypothetical protein